MGWDREQGVEVGYTRMTPGRRVESRWQTTLLTELVLAVRRVHCQPARMPRKTLCLLQDFVQCAQTWTCYPCREPTSSCSTSPIKQFGTYFSLGSVDAIKCRRFACDICRFVADCLDKKPEDLDGDNRITESAQFCDFRLPATIKSSVTHFHLTQSHCHL